VLVIDADEPMSTEWTPAEQPLEPSRAGAPAASEPASSRRKPRFFGLGRKKDGANAPGGKQAGETWFTDGPRDFNWD
jgi:hypothetical protein